MSTLERVRYVPGVRLTARDLQADLDARSAARAMHVRAVHGTWGVGIGFSIGALARWVIVGPGVAYDCHGRELVSSRTVALEPPPLPDSTAKSWFDLGVRRLEDSDLRSEETLCSPARRERPRFVWVTATADDPATSFARLGEVVPLGRVLVDTNGVAAVLLGPRRDADTAAPLRVAAGRTPVVVPADGSLDSEHAIDTSAGGFHQSPVYFVSLSAGDTSWESALRRGGLLGPFLAISDEAAGGFTLTIRFAATETTSFGRPSELSADWIGIETTRGCWPTVRPVQALREAGLLITPIAQLLGGFAPQPSFGLLVKTLGGTP